MRGEFPVSKSGVNTSQVNIINYLSYIIRSNLFKLKHNEAVAVYNVTL